MENTHIQTFTLANLRWVFTHEHVLGVYEPVAQLFKLLVASQFGNTGAEARAASLFLHCANAALASALALVLLRWGRGRRSGGGRELNTLCEIAAAAAAGMIWAGHPLSVEVVAWPSAQPYLLAAFFSSLSVGFHIRHRTSCPRLPALGELPPLSLARSLSAAAFVCAAFCKAPAIAVPVAAVGFDIWVQCSESGANGWLLHGERGKRREEEEEEEAEETLESTEREGAAWVRFSPLHLHPAAAVCLPMALSPRQFFQGSQQGLSASVVLVSELARPGPQRWLPLGSSQSSSRKV